MSQTDNANKDGQRRNRKIFICIAVALCSLMILVSVSGLLFQDVTNLVRKWQYKMADTGSVVKFGRYEQDGNLNNGAEDIQWIVLAREGNSILLISKYSLLSSTYVEWSAYLEYYINNAELDTTWANSVPRSILNNGFYFEAFTEAERERIILTTVVPDKHVDGNANNEPETQDHIYILSESEAIKYFQNDPSRKSKVTKYLMESEDVKADFSAWWLRSKAERENHVMTVRGNGSIWRKGYGTTCGMDIRPVLWLRVD